MMTRQLYCAFHKQIWSWYKIRNHPQFIHHMEFHVSYCLLSYYMQMS